MICTTVLSKNVLIEKIARMVSATAIHLPADVKEALQNAYEKETGTVAKNVFKSILDNIKIAEHERRPLCQDTGTVIFCVKAGEHFPFLGKLPAILTEATIKATLETPLRPNAVDIVTGKNSGTNTGDLIPWLEWEIIADSADAEITVFLKGGGSEAPSIAKTIPPAIGIKGALKLAVDTVFEYGPRPCPPLIVGVGLGATADIAMKLAKKALLNPVGERHARPEIAEFEKKLLEALNALCWGPHGVGGLTTALDARIEVAHRHPAAFCVGVATNCWAARRSKLRIREDRVEFLTHKFLNDGG